MKTFTEWMSNQVFSATEVNDSYVLYSPGADKFFWVVKAHNWENINRDAGWYAIVLEDREQASNILDGKRHIKINHTDEDMRLNLRLAKPDMDNSNPGTRLYRSEQSALHSLLN